MSTNKKGGNHIRLARKTDKDLVRRMRFKRVYRVSANLGLAATGLILALLLLFRICLYAWDIGTREAYDTFSGTIEKLNNVKQENRKLMLELRQDQGLFANKSRVYGLLESVRNGLPDSVWFSSLYYQKGVEKGPELLVTGFAAREEALKDFLVQLEGKKEFGRVTLNLTKNIPAARAFALSRGRARHEAVYFKITMAL
jgi:Tfp pilus assembly protein PilN